MTVIAQVLKFTQGDTFEVEGYLSEEGQPVDLTDVDIRSQVRDAAGTLVATLTATKLNQTTLISRGYYRLRCEAADTASWPIGTLNFNVRYAGAAISNGTHSTSPVSILVRRKLTD